ncbi:hypothetical protein M0R04_12865 [Candidatus Dojkabacteria bacterium]|jgi:hypothetical protein|nr:hypothetical protein [Candidatus Dojkabacteria bacterium]
MKDKIKGFLELVWLILTSPKMKTIYWQTFNGFIILVIAYLGEFNMAWVPATLACLNFLTKYINQKYLTA